MPKKIYIIENLDCANCAAKIEAKFNALPQVEEAVITFTTRQLRLTAQDPDDLIDELTQIVRTVEAEVTILPRDPHGHHHDHAHGEGCGCDHPHDHNEGCECGCHHDHHHEDSCGCGHHHDHKEAEPASDSVQILAGAGFFALGLLLQKMGLGFPAIGAFLCAYLVLGLRILITAGRNLVKGHIFDENFLMSLATLGAFAIQEYPEAVGVMLFYRIGEYFEEKAVARSRSQIMEAVDLRPETVNLVFGDELLVIPAGQARAGDLVLVRPGDRVPLDGTVVSGESRLDTSPITGEPVPRGIRPGDSVVSGCVNLGSPITIQVEKELSESMVTRILECVENASASKPKIDRFITRFARIYTPIVVALAVGTAIIPSLITGDWGYWVYTALSFLVMSCPCALVLSVPLAFFSGIGKASKQGILFKGGVSIEVLADVKAAVLDKTGTITMGNFEVRQITGQDTLAICAACEQFSTHPIAVSILSAAKEQGLTLAQPEELEEIPGHGIRAVISGKTVLCGNAKLLEKYGVSLPSLPETGETLVLLAVDGEFRGYVTISDTLKTGAKDAISRLKRQNIASAMLTGDREESARAVAAQVGIEEVHSRLLPEQKLEKLSAIREKYGPVLFVGDGINDAPVLSGADVGAAMGSGADAAIEAADVVFMTADVAAIPKAVEIARQTRKIAWQNVVFALAIKIIVMALGLCGFASMWMAVFADSGVAMLCVLNSIRVLYKK